MTRVTLNDLYKQEIDRRMLNERTRKNEEILSKFISDDKGLSDMDCTMEDLIEAMRDDDAFIVMCLRRITK